MKRFRLAFVTLAVFIAFHTTVPLQAASSPGPLASAQERSTPERVSADTPRATPGGATFTVPKE